MATHLPINWIAVLKPVLQMEAKVLGEKNLDGSFDFVLTWATTIW
jgi:hypothetical protein